MVNFRPRTKENFLNKFLSLVDKKGQDYCWIFNGFLDKNKYGKIKFKYKIYLAHRLMWETCFGSIPKNLFVCHKCDNPTCVNPKHLFLGTALDNNLDKIKKGRDHNAAKTECRNGHTYTKQNTSIHNNKRKCKTCDRLRHRSAYKVLKITKLEQIK